MLKQNRSPGFNLDYYQRGQRIGLRDAIRGSKNRGINLGVFCCPPENCSHFIKGYDTGYSSDRRSPRYGTFTSLSVLQ